jgi:choline transporter-like protein 2/4/5
MRLFAGLIVWLTIIMVYAALIILSAFLVWAGQQRAFLLEKSKCVLQCLGNKEKAYLDSLPPDQVLSSQRHNELALRVSGYIFISITAIALLLLLWMRSRIRLAIGIIKEATKAIGAMPSILFFPVFIYILMGVFHLYWIYIGL